MKYLLSIFLFCCFEVNALAQDSVSLIQDYKQKTSMMYFFAGPSSVSIRGGNQTVQSSGGGAYYRNTVIDKIGYSIGIGLAHNLNKHLELHTRFLWERKGSKANQDSIYLSSGGVVTVTNTVSANTNNDYIGISLIPEFMIGKLARFNIGAGVYFSTLIKSRVTSQYFYPTPHSVSHDGAYNNYDFGLLLNVGYTFPIKENLPFTVQFIDSYGLMQISYWHNRIRGSPSFYNSSYSIILGIRLANKKRFLFK